MNWFQAHAYVASWLSPLIALIALIRGKKGDGSPIAWNEVVIYVSFLSALAAAFTPSLDATAHYFAYFIVSFELGYLIMKK